MRARFQRRGKGGKTAAHREVGEFVADYGRPGKAACKDAAFGLPLLFVCESGMLIKDGYPPNSVPCLYGPRTHLHLVAPSPGQLAARPLRSPGLAAWGIRLCAH